MLKDTTTATRTIDILLNIEDEANKLLMMIENISKTSQLFFSFILDYIEKSKGVTEYEKVVSFCTSVVDRILPVAVSVK